MTTPAKPNTARRALATAVSLALTAVALPSMAQSGAVKELPTATAQTESESTYMIDQASSFKYSQPLLETPKTLTIIPASLMRDRGINSLKDALRSVPGITMAAGEGGTPTGDSMVIRGFSARTDIFADGIRDIAGYSRDTYNTESIEVTKGPGSSVSGRGSVGGSVNLVKKIARNETFTDVGLIGGSESDYRITLDTNFLLGETTALRINAMSTDGEVAGRDEVHNGMNAIALSFVTGLNTDSRFTLAAEYQDQDRLPDYGLPWVSNYSDRTDRVFLAPINKYAGGAPPVSFDNFYGNTHRDFEDIEATTFTARYEKDFSQNSTLRLQARYATVDRHSIVTAPRFTSETIDDVRFYGPEDIRWDDEKARDQENSMTALQIAYITSFNTGSIGHDLSVGAEYYDEEEKRWTESDNDTDNLNTGVNNLYNPEPNLAYSGRYTRTGDPADTGRSKTQAIYVFDTLTLNDSWEINGGLRLEKYENDTTFRGDDLDRDDTMTSWNIGAVYKIQENGTVYFGVGRSFNPAAEDLTASTRGNDVTLDPEESLGYEIGTKWNLFDGRLLATAAVFYTVKENARSDDPFDGGTAVTPGDDTRANLLDGEQEVKGLELSAYGQITDQLSIAAGYTFQDSEVTKASGDDVVQEGAELARTPKNAASLWLTYDFADNVSVGLGAEYMDTRYNSTSPGGRETAPSYTVYDLMASWKATDKLSLQLNGNNLGDERYIDQVGGGHFVPGPGRYFSVSAYYAF